jgi:adenosyl cobinamide kinase/adenosyl cobinamide phosphate guanylyltransferase
MFQTEFRQGCMLVLGGAKSGKSTFALKICNQLNKKPVFLATAQALDNEMAERIRRHKLERGNEWITEEEALDVKGSIQGLAGDDRVIIFDCLTLWVNNLYMEYGEDRNTIEKAMDDLVGILKEIKGAIIIVSNEVGSGIVPDNPLARSYRDDIGLLNQRIARLSRKVVNVIAGLPFVLKDE